MLSGQLDGLGCVSQLYRLIGGMRWVEGGVEAVYSDD